MNEALAAGVYVNMTGGVSIILCKSKDIFSEDTFEWAISVVHCKFVLLWDIW